MEDFPLGVHFIFRWKSSLANLTGVPPAVATTALAAGNAREINEQPADKNQQLVSLIIPF